jgi:hypothetical protein
MKKTFKILTLSLFAIAGLTVVSCDNEKYDPIIEGEKGVGKPIMNINNQGDNILLRENIKATVDKDGVLEITVKGADQTGNDILLLRTLKFETGTYPTNANKNEYYSAEHQLKYSTIDPDRPNIITGLVNIKTINRKARVVTGDFNINRMIPDNKDNPNLKPFAISGDFTDIPFKRKEATYLEAFVNGAALENPREKGEIKEGRVVITSLDGIEMTQELILDFPSDEKLVEMSDPKEFKKLGWFKVLYTSKYGIKYTSEGVEESEGFLRFDEVKYENGKLVSLKGRFDATLVQVDKPEEKVKITYGDFSVIFATSVSK